MTPQTYTLISPLVRRNAIRAIENAPDGTTVKIGPQRRSLDQNAKFHALCADIAASPMQWAGKRRSLEQWKALLISGHAAATGTAGEVIPGLEGEFVSIRESSARMGVGRASSLIEYTLAFCAANGVELTSTIASGYERQGEVA